jgi:signal transduction histidine kinase
MQQETDIALVMIRILILTRRKGATVRGLAKFLGWSRSSMGRLVQVIDEFLVAEAINLFERERRNDDGAEAIAEHLNLPVAVVYGALNRMLSQMGQLDPESAAETEFEEDDVSHLGQAAE